MPEIAPNAARQTDRATDRATDRVTGRDVDADPAGRPLARKASVAVVDQPAGETGGSDKPEPTRYGDWEVGGRCTDF